MHTPTRGEGGSGNTALQVAGRNALGINKKMTTLSQKQCGL